MITGHVHLLVGVPRCALPRPDSDAVEVVLCSPPKRLSSREIAPLSNRPRGGQRTAVSETEDLCWSGTVIDKGQLAARALSVGRVRLWGV